ncbi:MAG: antirestriction protein [Parvularcula sp.]|nr:antirestriction protein [Parvularcula sp.]
MSCSNEKLAPAGRAREVAADVSDNAAADSAARPRIYVACLAAYNNGRLHGAWIECSDAGDVREAVAAMLAASPEPNAEEWAIHDYDGFEGASVSEYTGFDDVCALAEFIGEHGSLGAKLYAHFGEDLNEAIAAFEEYAGEFKSAADFAEDLIRETGPEIPKALEFYIDWASLARDMELNGEILAFETAIDEVHIFWAR